MDTQINEGIDFITMESTACDAINTDNTNNTAVDTSVCDVSNFEITNTSPCDVTGSRSIPCDVTITKKISLLDGSSMCGIDVTPDSIEHDVIQNGEVDMMDICNGVEETVADLEQKQSFDMDKNAISISTIKVSKHCFYSEEPERFNAYVCSHGASICVLIN